MATKRQKRASFSSEEQHGTCLLGNACRGQMQRSIKTAAAAAAAVAAARKTASLTKCSVLDVATIIACSTSEAPKILGLVQVVTLVAGLTQYGSCLVGSMYLEIWACARRIARQRAQYLLPSAWRSGRVGSNMPSTTPPSTSSNMSSNMSCNECHVMPCHLKSCSVGRQ